MDFSSIKWGDVPTWFAAIGTVATFIIYYFLLRGEIGKREDEKKEREIFTQRRISAWIDGETLIIQNKGYEPIYYLVVYYGPMGINFRSLDEPGKHTELVIGTLGPDQRIEEKIKRHRVEREIFPDIPEVEMEFTDCQGKHWVRESSGMLKEVKSRRPFD